MAKNFLIKPVIKATRYYMTGGGGVSMWHHDEKNDGYASKGMIMIVYLNDVVFMQPFKQTFLRCFYLLEHAVI